MSNLLVMFIFGAVCGFAMWFVLSASNPNYKRLYALYLSLIVGILFAFTAHWSSLFATGIAMVAYLLFLSFTNVDHPRVWVLPSFWLVGLSLYLIVKNQAKLEYGVAILALGFLTCIYPSMGQIQRSKDAAEIDYSDQAEYDRFIVRKHKKFAYYGLITGLVGALAVIVISIIH